MRRREFIAGLGMAAAMPLAAWGQQPGLPVIGFLSTRSADDATPHTNAFRRGLEEMGFVEGRSIAVEYRWAMGDYSKLPQLATDLLGQPLALMVSAGDPAALAAKAARPMVPLVFVVGQDPVSLGLVDSMNRPGKAATGVNFFTGDLGGKRMELLCAMTPSARSVGLLLNPRFATAAAELRQAVSAAAPSLGRDLIVHTATSDAEIEVALAAIVNAGAGGLIVQNDPFFDTRRSQIIALSSQYRLPGIFHIREFPADGGLMSYGASLSDTYRQVGVYAGKILRGGRPDDLPVLQPTKFELVINMRTAKAFGLAVPQSVLVAADELIE